MRVEQRAELLASRVFDAMAKRRMRCAGKKEGRLSQEVNDRLHDVAKKATVEYVTYWFDTVWPILFLGITNTIWTELSIATLAVSTVW